VLQPSGAIISDFGAQSSKAFGVAPARINRSFLQLLRAAETAALHVRRAKQ
jgi:hypothetical protein